MRNKSQAVIYLCVCIVLTIFSIASCQKSNQLIPSGIYVRTNEKSEEERIVVTKKGITLENHDWDEEIRRWAPVNARMQSINTGKDISTAEFIEHLKNTFDYETYKSYFISHDEVNETTYDDGVLYYEFWYTMNFSDGYEIKLGTVYCPSLGCFGAYRTNEETGETYADILYECSDK